MIFANPVHSLHLLVIFSPDANIHLMYLHKKLESVDFAPFVRAEFT